MAEYRLWTKEEDDYIIEYYSKLEYPVIAKILNRTISSVTHRVKKFGLKKDNGRPKVGEKYNYLTIISLEIRGLQRLRKCYAICLCDCGKRITTIAKHLKTGNTKSCGCMMSELVRQGKIKHGAGYTRLYKIWKGMRSRCFNPNNKHYQYYGGRNITIVDEWQNFTNFQNWSLSNGYEDNLSIDRINVNGDYEPNNCRFITMAEQSKNKRNTIMITAFGETKCCADWSKDKRCTISYVSLKDRIKSGMNPEDAITKKSLREVKS